MIPPSFVEWIVWSNLDDYKEPELILLKGHLLLDVFLAQRLSSVLKLSKRDVDELSFFRKLSLLEKVVVRGDSAHKFAIDLARELNSLRNRAAHEILFKDGPEELLAWSNKVLAVLPSMKFQKYTPRTRMTQAVAALAKVLSTYEETSNTAFERAAFGVRSPSSS